MPVLTIAGIPAGSKEQWRPGNVTEQLRVRNSGTLLQRNHGGVSGEDFAGHRDVTVELRTVGSPEANQQRLDELEAAVQPGTDDIEYTSDRGGYGRLLFCRRTALVPVWTVGRTILDVLVELRAWDPVWYGPPSSVTLTPFVGTQFAEYPASGEYPKLYASGGSGGGQTVVNAGMWPTWPRFVIVGPTSGSMNVTSLENVTTGRQVRFTANGGLSIPSGSTLVVDMHPARRVVQFTTGASRLNTVVNLDSWWQVQPGTNELRLRAGGSTDGASAEVQVRAGWL